VSALEVLLSDVPIGTLVARGDGRIVFRFSAGYPRMDPRPVLGQHFEDDLGRTYVGRKPGDLPPFFAHLLPEGRLRAVIERSLSLESAADLKLLAAVGADLPGAARIRPLVDTLPDAADEPDERNVDEDEIAPAGGFRFSLAGVQLKFSLLRGDDRFTVPARNEAGEWIVKLALAEFDGLAENEHATMAWARAVGFDVAECHVVDAASLGALAEYAREGTRALAVRRFDREDGRRVHQEDMAQVLARAPQPDGSEKYMDTYDRVATLVRGIVDEEASRELVRRLTFALCSGNNDAHLKNWSFVYRDAVTPALSPLYDQVATVAWPRFDRRLALKLGGARDFGRISTDNFRRLAGRAGLPEARTLEDVRGVVDACKRAWEAGASAAFPDAHAAAIREHWARVPLLRDAGTLGAG
jgi:serine/threonine-protein kinase HipA